MKILKNSLIILLFMIFGCNSDQNNLDIENDRGNTSINQTSSAKTYTLEEILKGMRSWDSLRTNTDELLDQFQKYNALNIDISQFPEDNALHAYACILNGELKFAVISEVYDNDFYQDSLMNHIKIVDLHYADIATVTEQTYESYTFPLPTQYIQAADAISRMEDWNMNYSNWLNSSSDMYQGFNIPTYSLQAQNYTVYFGLKSNLENLSSKDADLVFYDRAGAFYDTVAGYPPIKYQTKYYLLELM